MTAKLLRIEPNVEASGFGEAVSQNFANLEIELAKIDTDVLYQDVTERSNTLTAEQEMLRYALPAGLLAKDGDAVDIIFAGTAAANANAKTVRLYFGASIIWSNSNTPNPNNVQWSARVRVVRRAPGVQRSGGSGQMGANIEGSAATSAESETGEIVIKLTLEGAAASDLAVDFLFVHKIKAP